MCNEEKEHVSGNGNHLHLGPGDTLPEGAPAWIRYFEKTRGKTSEE